MGSFAGALQSRKVLSSLASGWLVKVRLPGPSSDDPATAIVRLLVTPSPKTAAEVVIGTLRSTSTLPTPMSSTVMLKRVMFVVCEHDWDRSGTEHESESPSETDGLTLNP